jgi:hypothetical protein
MDEHDKILRFPSKILPLTNTPECKALNDVLNTREMETSGMHPLEVWLNREFLIRELELALKSVEENGAMYTTEEARFFIEGVKLQLIDFLDELKCTLGERVHVALFLPDNEPVIPLGEDDDFPPDAWPDFPLPDEDEGYGNLGTLEDILGDDDLPL